MTPGRRRPPSMQPPSLRLRNLKTVKQMVEQYPEVFTSEASLRWTIFNAEANGFDACIVRIGRRVLIDTDRVREWLAERRAAPGNTSA